MNKIQLCVEISEEVYNRMYKLLENEDIGASHSVRSFLEEELNQAGEEIFNRALNRRFVDMVLENNIKQN
jgi:hypothetical protein